jgi:hypothetical protein
MTTESSEGPTTTVRLDEHAVVLRVHDSTWRGVRALLRAAPPWTEHPGILLRVDLQEVCMPAASAFWLAALASLARIARARRCRVVFVGPPRALAEPLLRMGLEVDQNGYESLGHRLRGSTSGGVPS